MLLLLLYLFSSPLLLLLLKLKRRGGGACCCCCCWGRWWWGWRLWSRRRRRAKRGVESDSTERREATVTVTASGLPPHPPPSPLPPSFLLHRCSSSLTGRRRHVRVGQLIGSIIQLESTNLSGNITSFASLTEATAKTSQNWCCVIIPLGVTVTKTTNVCQFYEVRIQCSHKRHRNRVCSFFKKKTFLCCFMKPFRQLSCPPQHVTLNGAPRVTTQRQFFLGAAMFSALQPTGDTSGPGVCRYSRWLNTFLAFYLCSWRYFLTAGWMLPSTLPPIVAFSQLPSYSGMLR